MKDYNQFAACLQEFFDKDVDELAKKTSFFKRKRKMTAITWLVSFLQSITNIKYTLEDFVDLFNPHISCGHEKNSEHAFLNGYSQRWL